MSMIPADQPGEWARKAQHLLATGAPPHFAPDADMLAIQQRQLASHEGLRVACP